MCLGKWGIPLTIRHSSKGLRYSLDYKTCVYASYVVIDSQLSEHEAPEAGYYYIPYVFTVLSRLYNMWVKEVCAISDVESVLGALKWLSIVGLSGTKAVQLTYVNSHCGSLRITAFHMSVHCHCYPAYFINISPFRSQFFNACSTVQIVCCHRDSNSASPACKPLHHHGLHLITQIYFL